MICHQAGSQASQAESRRVQEAYPWPASSRPPATKSIAQCGRCQKVIMLPLFEHQTCSLCNRAGCEDCLHCVLCDWCWEAVGCTNCKQATRFALDEYTNAYLCHPCVNSEVAESYYRTMQNNNRACSTGMFPPTHQRMFRASESPPPQKT